MQRQSGAYISHRWMSLLLEELVFRVLGRSPNYHQSQQVQFYANRQIVFMMSQSEIGLRVSFDAGILPRQLHRDEVRCRARICFRHRMPFDNLRFFHLSTGSSTTLKWAPTHAISQCLSVGQSWVSRVASSSFIRRP